MLLGVLLLAGHYGLLFGGNFFTDSDSIAQLLNQTRNAATWGWRPDVLFGQPFFASGFATHVWSVSRFWIEMFEDSRLGYQVRIFITIWIGCVALYILLRKSVPSLGKLNSFLLSAVIAFGSLRYEYLFNSGYSIEITGVCFLSIVLSDLFKQPRIRQYFYYTSIIFAVAFLGGVVTTYRILIFSGLFSTGVAVYNRWGISSKELRIALVRFFLLNIASGLTFLILAAWVFYSMFVEFATVDYVRDPD